MKRNGSSSSHELFCLEMLAFRVWIENITEQFDLVPHDRLLTKIAATGVDFRVVVWVKEFLLGRSQRVRVDG